MSTLQVEHKKSSSSLSVSSFPILKSVRALVFFLVCVVKYMTLGVEFWEDRLNEVNFTFCVAGQWALGYMCVPHCTSYGSLKLGAAVALQEMHLSHPAF